MFFTKTEPAEIEPQQVSDQTRLEEINQELVRVQAELAQACKDVASYSSRMGPDRRTAIFNGQVFARLNAMTADPVRSALEARCRAIDRKRGDILGERKDLMQALGLIR